jgi:hypothetical protein
VIRRKNVFSKVIWKELDLWREFMDISKMSSRKVHCHGYFAKTERSLLRWDVDDSNNIMVAFHGLV